MCEARAVPADWPRVIGALVGAGMFAGLSVTIGLWAGFAWAFAGFFFVIALAIVTIVGLPLYLAAAALGRVYGRTAAIAGLTAGVSIAMLLFPASALLAAAFGGCGAASGLVFFAILRWPLPSRARRSMVVGAILALSAAAFAASWAAQDHSCHNPVWYGRGIAPSTQFRIDLPPGAWRKVAAELERFARANRWSLRIDAAYSADHPWLAISACRADGTDIQLYRGPDDDRFDISVYQPQGGDSWEPPMRDLHARMRAKWPGAIDYLDALGAPTRPPPGWLTERSPASS